MIRSFLNGRVIIKVGDLTGESVDAIVNAANSTLLGGGGVDGAIHQKGGPSILEECRAIRETQYKRGLPVGKAVITTGGNLPARHVIHTVGPIYGMNNGRDAELLANCYINSLDLAAKHGLSSVAFPAISTGVYRYPKVEAARVASAAIAGSLASLNAISEVRLVFVSLTDAQVFLNNSDF
jgi:O-acetyl-ADP-ribose deacetylase (regulator of RNase III)